jgi:hypothetical protein
VRYRFRENCTEAKYGQVLAAFNAWQPWKLSKEHALAEVQCGYNHLQAQVRFLFLLCCQMLAKQHRLHASATASNISSSRTHSSSAVRLQAPAGAGEATYKHDGCSAGYRYWWCKVQRVVGLRLCCAAGSCYNHLQAQVRHLVLVDCTSSSSNNIAVMDSTYGYDHTQAQVRLQGLACLQVGCGCSS